MMEFVDKSTPMTLVRRLRLSLIDIQMFFPFLIPSGHEINGLLDADQKVCVS